MQQRHGEVVDTRDVIVFEGTSAAQLRKEFEITPPQDPREGSTPRSTGLEFSDEDARDFRNSITVVFGSSWGSRVLGMSGLYG